MALDSVTLPAYFYRCDHAGCPARTTSFTTAGQAFMQARSGGWTLPLQSADSFCPDHSPKGLTDDH